MLFPKVVVLCQWIEKIRRNPFWRYIVCLPMTFLVYKILGIVFYSAAASIQWHAALMKIWPIGIPSVTAPLYYAIIFLYYTKCPPTCLAFCANSSFLAFILLLTHIVLHDMVNYNKEGIGALRNRVNIPDSIWNDGLICILQQMRVVFLYVPIRRDALHFERTAESLYALYCGVQRAFPTISNIRERMTWIYWNFLFWRLACLWTPSPYRYVKDCLYGSSVPSMPVL